MFIAVMLLLAFFIGWFSRRWYELEIKKDEERLDKLISLAMEAGRNDKKFP